MAEFGDFRSADQQILANELLEQEKHRVGFAFWTWKENCGGSSTWGMFEGIDCAPGATPRARADAFGAGRERLLARVYPQASADPKLTYHYDSDTGAFTLQANGRAGDPPTLVYVPREVTGEVTVLGAFSDRSVTRLAMAAGWFRQRRPAAFLDRGRGRSPLTDWLLRRACAGSETGGKLLPPTRFANASCPQPGSTNLVGGKGWDSKR